MRINVYSQELTDEVVRVEKISNTGRPYVAAQLILHSSPMLHHPPADDDRSAVTFWLPSSAGRCESMAQAFERIAAVFRTETQRSSNATRSDEQLDEFLGEAEAALTTEQRWRVHEAMRAALAETGAVQPPAPRTTDADFDVLRKAQKVADEIAEDMRAFDAKVQPPAPEPPDRNMEGAREFVNAIMSGAPIWPNPWGQDVACAAYFIHRERTDPPVTQRGAPEPDDYKAWYDEAMVASNEAGFVGLSAAETIRELASASPSIAQPPAPEPPEKSALQEEALRWAKVIRVTLPLYMRDCNVLDDLEDFLRRVGAEAPPSIAQRGAE